MRLSRLIALFCFLFPGVSLSGAVRDDYGYAVALEAPARRIVSLSPHLTELAYAAGAGGRMVGAVQHSDHPPEALELPRVGSEAGIDLEAVLALQPDLVVAWPNAGSLKAVERIESLGVPVFRSEPRALEDIATTMERLGELAGTQEMARIAADEFRTRVARLAARYAARPKVRVFYQVWDRPLITVNGDHVISKVIELCGGANVFAHLPGLAPHIDREAVLNADPDAIVASGPDGERPARLDLWRSLPGLTAAARGHLYTIPPELIQRHTPRLLDGAKRLCRHLEQVRTRR